MAVIETSQKSAEIDYSIPFTKGFCVILLPCYNRIPWIMCLKHQTFISQSTDGSWYAEGPILLLMSFLFFQDANPIMRAPSWFCLNLSISQGFNIWIWRKGAGRGHNSPQAIPKQNICCPGEQIQLCSVQCSSTRDPDKTFLLSWFYFVV